MFFQKHQVDPLYGTLAYEGIADNTGTITKSIDHINHLQYNNTYDSTDRLTASTITDTSTQQRKAMFEYNFDLNNNMSEFTTLTPKGHNKVQYTYGKDNLLTGMTLDNQKTLDYVYNGIGLPTRHTVNLTYPLTTTYTYHGITEDNIVYKNHLIRKETIGNDDFTYLYNYDANNNITKIFNGDYNEKLEDYSYDNLGQLTKAEYLNRYKRHEYTYDDGGNITEERVYDTSGSTPVLSATNTYTYGDHSWGDLLTSYNGNTITYDEIGNPLSYRDGISFTWSNGRQLHSYTKNNNTITYTYDNNGMRLSKDVGNTHYSYLYQNGLLVQETIGDKVLDYSYTSGGQIVSVRYKTNAADPGVYYYYALNSRGDVVGLYDENGALYAKYTYDVWGNPISVKNASGANLPSDDIANIQSLRYRGYYYDSDTGFYYLQSRYYDPVTHRFINADGLVSTGTGVLGYNMFAYCNNNPVNCFDPSGNETVKQVSESVAGIRPNNNGWTILDVTFAQAAGVGLNDQYYKVGSTDSNYTIYVIHTYLTLKYVPFTVWIYDNRNELDADNPDPNYKVLNSHYYSLRTVRSQIIQEIINYNFNYPRPSNAAWNMTYDDMEIEWDAHNYFYDIGFKRESSAEVDFNMNENRQWGFILAVIHMDLMLALI